MLNTVRIPPDRRQWRKALSSLLLAVLIFLFLGSVAHAEDEMPQLMPYDEAERDQSLLAFRARMIQVVAFKEPERLVEMIDPKINIGLDQPSGPRAFVEFWRPETIDSEIWEVLGSILQLGGGFVRSENGVMFCAPYVFVNFPAERDILSHGVITQENIDLKQLPTTASLTLVSLSYDIVAVDDWNEINDESGTEAFRWVKVSTLGGKEGYVQRKHIRSPSDYSACFLQRKNKPWKLESLVLQQPSIEGFSESISR